MKTFKDLMNLLIEQQEKNEGKRVQFLFEISNEHMWVSFHSVGLKSDNEKEIYLNHFSIKNENFLQQAYWVVKNNGRI